MSEHKFLKVDTLPQTNWRTEKQKKNRKKTEKNRKKTEKKTEIRVASPCQLGWLLEIEEKQKKNRKKQKKTGKKQKKNRNLGCFTLPAWLVARNRRKTEKNRKKNRN